MRFTFLFLLHLLSFQCTAQPNCEVYRMRNQESLYQACKQSEKTRFYYQFSREYQEVLDESLAIDSTFAYAYRAKSTAYLKSGDFITWKSLIDRAVRYDILGNIGYRGWCRFQFFRDYEGAINDISYLENTLTGNIGYSANGEYHLLTAKALCLKMTDRLLEAIHLMELQFSEASHPVEKFDYLHLGVMYLEANELERAKKYLELQVANYDFAEPNYYLAIVSKRLDDVDAYELYKETAKRLYSAGVRMSDPYVEYVDQVGLQAIEAL